MSKVAAKERKKTRPRSAVASSASFLPWKLVAFAAIPVALSVYYLGWVAPDAIPVPEGVRVPFPALTKWLERVVGWCSRNRLDVVLIGGGVLLGGVLLRFLHVEERYYVWVSILAGAMLLVTYFSVSAPIDRLLKSVEDDIQDNRVPSHNRTR